MAQSHFLFESSALKPGVDFVGHFLSFLSIKIYIYVYIICKCQIVHFPFLLYVLSQFLTGQPEVDFQKPQRKGRLKLCHQVIWVIHGYESSNNTEWFTRSLEVEAEQFMHHEFSGSVCCVDCTHQDWKWLSANGLLYTLE